MSDDTNTRPEEARLLASERAAEGLQAGRGGDRGVQKRMARPVCKGFVRGDLISLRQRIRPGGRTPAKMEIRASRSS